jgi:hypothetical protein
LLYDSAFVERDDLGVISQQREGVSQIVIIAGIPSGRVPSQLRKGKTTRGMAAPAFTIRIQKFSPVARENNFFCF